jgi:hypothetical protein
MAKSPRNQDVSTIDSNDPVTAVSTFDAKKEVISNPSASNDELDSILLQQERDQAEDVQNTEPSREEAHDSSKSFDSWLVKSDSDVSIFEDKEQSDDDQAEVPSTETSEQPGDDIPQLEMPAEKESIENGAESVQSTKEKQDLRSENAEHESVEDKHITSVESPECINQEEHSIAAPTDDEIRNLVTSLRDSDVLSKADESIKALDMALDSRVVTEKSARNHTAEKIVESDGVAIIIDAMEKWQQQSVEVVDVGTCLLVALTQVVPGACHSIAQTGLGGIVETAKQHPENYFMHGNVLALLINLSTVDDETTKQEVSSDQYIDHVMKTMQAWPDKPYIQKCGAGYFVRINDIKAALRDRNEGSVSGDCASVMLPYSSESNIVGDVVQDSEKQEGQDNKLEQEKPQETDMEPSEANATVSAALAVQPTKDKMNNEMEQERPQEAELEPSEAKTTVPAPLAVQPTEDDITAMLRSLRDSRNAEEAKASIKALVRSTDSRVIKSAKVRKSVTAKIVRQGGVAAIIVALEKWHEKSEDFSYHALTLLVSISKFVAKSRKSIATIGCKTVLDMAKSYQDDYFMRGNILALLQNLSNEKDESTKQEVAADEYIDCVVETMKKWPDDSYIQSCGCDYFARIGKMEGMTARLCAKRIGSLMGEVLDNFHEVDDNVYGRARNVMNVIHVGCN